MAKVAMAIRSGLRVSIRGFEGLIEEAEEPGVMINCPLSIAEYEATATAARTSREMRDRRNRATRDSCSFMGNYPTPPPSKAIEKRDRMARV
jgi:hypothetical protein